MELNPTIIQLYRARTYHTASRLRRREQAVEFVKERGFIFFWPIKGITMPSLWAAVAGDRPVADAHDDPGHVTWGWKDALLGSQAWYYAKVLRKRATIIAMDVLPFFYALSENYGSPEDDYLTLYEQGRMTQEARTMYETLLQEGPLDTLALRKATRMTSRESDTRFNRALTDLQADFKVVPTGVSPVGRWKYAFIYAITARHYPDLIERTRMVSERQARRKLVELYLRSVGAAQRRDMALLFGWAPGDLDRALREAVEAGTVRGGLSMPETNGEWWAVEEVLG